MKSNADLSSKGTDSLIERLATQAGKRQPGRLSFAALLPVALVVSTLASVAVVLLAAGARPDIVQILLTWTFEFKVIGMIVIAAGASQLVWSTVRPGAPVHWLRAIGPGGVFLLAGALIDRSGFPLFGVHKFSVLSCAGIIIASSIPALAVILAAMRAGTPTRLVQAGAVAGFLAGAIGALAYTLACLNDGATFVALWYSVAIAVVAIIGAIIGPRMLAW